MEYYAFSSNNELNRENLYSNHEQDVPLFGQFPSPLFDDIQHNHRQQMTSEPPPSPVKTKRVRKKRSAGKTDRHSKIHTAQGLRDRRMRLSLHIAHKFFGLQDMLGFDKASKTIEWLFCKSKKAIDEVTESVKSQHTTQSVGENNESCKSPISDCEVDSGIEFDATSNKGKQLIKDGENPKKPSESDLVARELRDKARARARARMRTREKLMFNNPDKSKEVFGENPNGDFDQLHLGFSANPNSHYIQDSSTSPLEYPGVHHFFHHTQLNNVSQTTEDYLGTSSSSFYSGYGYNKNCENPPAGWLNSSNSFLGFLGGWDSESFTENYGLYPTLAPLTGDIHGQNYGSVLIPPSNFVHFQTQNQSE
ncbi:hypothetical protein L1987_38869 [Smallanthus sonchifolius]|uniref:Uncharacterized protein n=1 Tax=Smallanthus sonchifolius TaxID=185202 RepID=A0ACB9HLJ8_9ASTR|nr:hypothetical protein L1987_38869 [Smallanthus sonchifolius]